MRAQCVSESAFVPVHLLWGLRPRSSSGDSGGRREGGGSRRPEFVWGVHRDNFRFFLFFFFGARREFFFYLTSRRKAFQGDSKCSKGAYRLPEILADGSLTKGMCRRDEPPSATRCRRLCSSRSSPACSSNIQGGKPLSASDTRILPHAMQPTSELLPCHSLAARGRFFFAAGRHICELNRAVPTN